MGNTAAKVQREGERVVGKVAHGAKSVGDDVKSKVTGMVGGRKRRRKGGKTRRKTGGKKRTRRHPHKGQRSKTRKGRKDFVTHKGDKAYNRSGHRQYRKRRPYSKRRR